MHLTSLLTAKPRILYAPDRKRSSVIWWRKPSPICGTSITAHDCIRLLCAHASMIKRLQIPQFNLPEISRLPEFRGNAATGPSSNAVISLYRFHCPAHDINVCFEFIMCFNCLYRHTLTTWPRQCSCCNGHYKESTWIVNESLIFQFQMPITKQIWLHIVVWIIKKVSKARETRRNSDILFWTWEWKQNT